MATQDERRQATRAKLIETARGLMLCGGVAGTTTRAILDIAKISRGALYHHFASLEELIAAVYEEESAAAIGRAAHRHTATGSSIEDLLGTCLAWLDELVDPKVARLLVVEGPSALGWERCQEIEARHSLGQMQAWLTAASEDGEVAITSSDLIARVLNAVLTELALSIVHSKKKSKARADAETIFRQLVNGLRSAC